MSAEVRVRTKMCGLTRVQDIAYAVNAGVDAIGFVFYPPSPRAVSATDARELATAVPAFVQIVGLFVNASVADVQQVLQAVPVDILQFHGDESPAQCADIAAQTQRRWIKALAVKADTNIAQQIASYAEAGASAILLDAWHPQLKGGTGQTFDWAQWPNSTIPLILAGGLNPHNVYDAITQLQPHAVDVSGGVEASKGIKDQSLINQFMQEVMRGVQRGQSK